MTGAAHVLVIEDDDVIRETLVEFLTDHGHPAQGAANGRAALDQLAASPAPPCLIVLDLMMPVMDGRAFREEQLRVPSLADIPVVVISANRDLGAATRGMSPTAALRKPLQLSELLELVARYC